MVRTVGYGMEYGTVVWYDGGVQCQVRYGAVVRYDGTVVQCIAPTVPLHRTTLVFPKFVVKSTKLVVKSAKLVVKIEKLVVKTFQILVHLLGTVYPAPYHRTVPAYRLLRITVPTVLHERTYCTVPTCTVYLTSVPTVPYRTPSR